MTVKTEVISRTPAAILPGHRDSTLVRTAEATRVLNELTSDALARGEELDRLEVRRPTLEEVYLALLDKESE